MRWSEDNPKAVMYLFDLLLQKILKFSPQRSNLCFLIDSRCELCRFRGKRAFKGQSEVNFGSFDLHFYLQIALLDRDFNLNKSFHPHKLKSSSCSGVKNQSGFILYGPYYMVHISNSVRNLRTGPSGEQSGPDKPARISSEPDLLNEHFFP